MTITNRIVLIIATTLICAACQTVTVPSGSPDRNQEQSLIPPNNGPVVITDLAAPSPCDTTTEFVFVGNSTLQRLGFDTQSEDPDFLRPGRFWVTAEALDSPFSVPLPNAQKRRLLCVKWPAGGDVGLNWLTVEDDWMPPTASAVLSPRSLR